VSIPIHFVQRTRVAIGTVDPMHIPWDVVTKVATVLGTVAGIMGWDSWKKKGVKALERVRDAGVDALRHLVDEIKTKVILGHPVEWWEHRLEGLLALAGIDIDKLPQKLRAEAVTAARRELHNVVAKHQLGGELDHLRGVLKDFEKAERAEVLKAKPKLKAKAAKATNAHLPR
jgi:hypothetical protein